MRELGEDIGGGGRYNECLSALRLRDMLDRRFLHFVRCPGRRPQAGNDLVTRDRSKRECGYELFGTLRHHDMGIEAGLLQGAD